MNWLYESEISHNQKPLAWIYFCGRGFVVFTHRITRRYPMSKNILRYLLLFHKFTKTIAQPRSKPMGLRVQCNFEHINAADRKIYNSLVFLLYFMDKIAPQHTWRQRLVELLTMHPNISKTWMGFPENWQSYPIWHIEQ